MKKLLIIAALMLATVVSVASCDNTPDDPAVTTDGETTTKVEDVTTVKPEDDTTVAPETDPVTEPATEPVTEPVTEPQGLAGDVIAYLPLDKKVGNKIDNSVIAPKKAGDPDFQAGLKSAAFATGGTGYINLGDTWTPGTDSFAVGMWVKGTTNNGQVCLLANMSWGPEDTGFVFVWYQHQDEIRAVFNFDGVKVDKRFNVPDDYMDRWMYVVMVVDREANQVKMSFDLNEFQVHDLSYSKDTNFNSYELQDGMRPIAIGNDGIGGRSVPNGNLIDEVLVFNKAISHDEILEIGKYYKAEPAQKMDSAADLLNEQFKNAGRNQTDVADVQKDGDLEFVRLTATGGDPNVMLRGTGRNIGDLANRVNAKFIAIKYRTNDATNGRFFVGSAGGPSGSGDTFAMDWNADGKWHVAIIDIALTGITAVKDDVLHYIRMDYFDGQAAEGAYFDVAGVGYYATADDAAKAFGIAVADATAVERQNAYRLSIDNTSYIAGEKTQILVTVYGEGTDALKIWDKDALAADENAAPIATLGFDVLKSGEKNDLVKLLGAKLVADKNYVVKLVRGTEAVKEVSFTYTSGTTNIVIDGVAATYNYGDALTGTIAGWGAPKAWVGVGTEAGYSTWYYITDKQGQTVKLADLVKDLMPGKYVIRVIADDKGWTTTDANLLKEVKFEVTGTVESFITTTDGEGKVVTVAGVTASSTSNENDTNIPEKAINGKNDDRWAASPKGTGDLTIDLGQVRNFNQLYINWENAGLSYRIFVSEDGENFTEIVRNVKHGGGAKTYNFDAVDARYIKISRDADDGSDNFWFSTWEVNALSVKALPVAD
jgi:hypothetical protein